MKFKLTLLFTALSIACIILLFPSSVRWLGVSMVLLASSVFISFGVVNIGSGFFYPTVSKLKKKEVLLTFDDGPDPEKTPAVLQILRQKNVKAIFFVIGQKAEAYPELVQQILGDGHVIGNHTYSHNVFFALKRSSFISNEIDRAESILKQAGSSFSYLFRPPVGYLNPIISRVLRRRRAVVVGWSLRSFDTVLGEERLLERLLKSTKAGDIVLFHDTQEVTGRILGKYIDIMRQRHVNFVTSTKNLFEK